ncbi:MAG: protein-export chaperone SecB [Pseudomonadota bacterium]
MAEQQTEERRFGIQRLYTKDISFELPSAPDIFRQEWQPDIGLDLHVKVNLLSAQQAEVIITVEVEAKQSDQTVFLIEVQQAGIFSVTGFSQEELMPLLHIGAANTLFPYAREVVSNLVTHGSLPPLILQPVNFEALYQQRLAQDASEADTADAT